MSAEMSQGKALVAKGDTNAALALFKSLGEQEKDPQTVAEAMHAFGVLNFQNKPSKEAAKESLTYIDKAIATFPDNAKYWNSKAIVLEKSGDVDGALAAFKKASELQPDNPKWLVNMAKLLKAQNKFEEALQLMLKVAERGGAVEELNYKIGTLYKALNNTAKAVEYFRKHLEVEPGHQYAKFWLSALTGEGQKDVFKPDMVARLFDSYSETFDSHLVQTLGYRTPEVLFGLLKDTAQAQGIGFEVSSTGKKPFRRCVDLGCGTGLMGVLVRSICDVLEGVDLSKGMIDQAMTRKRLYDVLEVDECGAYLDRAALGMLSVSSDSAPSTSAYYDFVLAADVLVYISDLLPLFKSARNASSKGAIFGFSTEQLSEAEAQQQPAAAKEGFLLRSTGRYAHKTAYVQATLQASGWKTVKVLSSEIRKNLGVPVVGDLFIAIAE